LGDKHINVEVDRGPHAIPILLDSLPKEDLLRLSTKIAQQLGTKGAVTTKETIPVEIFSGTLSPAESIVKYMKENMEMTLHDIGGALCRDERGIWGSYNRAKKKMPEAFNIVGSTVQVPVEIFKDRTKSILEAVIVYLVDQCKLKFSRIAKLLNKKYSTVYTTHQRAHKKPSKGNAV